jgi:predicted dehydrogenase
MSQSQPVYTVAIAGMGKRGVHHADAFSKNPRFKLVGVCDIDAGRMASAQQTYGTEFADTDAGKLLAQAKPDIFVFCTLPHIRLPLIKAGVDAGVKMIAFEKPLAMSMSEAIDVMALLRPSGIKGVVSHQHRYGEHYAKVAEIVKSGAIGQVQTIHAHSLGWMLHMITHLIDYMRWYNDGAEAEWAVGQADGKEKFADIHTSPDYIAGLVQFANGVRGIVECGAGAPDVPEVEYWWHKNRIRVSGTEGFAEVLTGGGWRAVTKDSCGVISGPGKMDYAHDMPPYVQEMADWLDDPAKVHPCNVESAYKGLEIMMAICRSVVQRGKVAIPLGRGEPEIPAMKEVLP